MDVARRDGSTARGGVADTGRFVAFLRNRPIGEESVRTSITAGGGLRLQVETALVLHKLDLRQTVTARFGPDLRPEWCTIATVLNRRQMRLELEIGREHAVMCSSSGTASRSRDTELPRPPLLLADNCFALHAVAAFVARRTPEGGRTFTALPSFEDLTVTAPGTGAVLLGGTAYPPPAVTLNLRSELSEHAWFRGDVVERLIIPQAQIRVDAGPVREGDGGCS
jgi:hypothetical protein